MTDPMTAPAFRFWAPERSGRFPVAGSSLFGRAEQVTVTANLHVKSYRRALGNHPAGSACGGAYSTWVTLN